jgi:hypothetical protein
LLSTNYQLSLLAFFIGKYLETKKFFQKNLEKISAAAADCIRHFWRAPPRDEKN